MAWPSVEFICSLQGSGVLDTSGGEQSSYDDTDEKEGEPVVFVFWFTFMAITHLL
ncbi:hypothetical protein DSECCO2_73130 [anaerobic digester metagenome]